MSLRGSFMSGASIVRPSVSLYLGEESPNRALPAGDTHEAQAQQNGIQQTACHDAHPISRDPLIGILELDTDSWPFDAGLWPL